jgi:hypothetical protein
MDQVPTNPRCRRQSANQENGLKNRANSANDIRTQESLPGAPR